MGSRVVDGFGIRGTLVVFVLCCSFLAIGKDELEGNATSK